MDKVFKHVAIVGLGLIGGSLARAIKSRNLAEKITGYGRKSERMKKALDLGLIDDYFTGFERGFEDVDLVVIGTPVSKIALNVKELIPYLCSGTVVTDVGSVKEAIVADIEAGIPEDIFYIGGHPIAGTENSGFEYSLEDLFEGRICVLTPTDNSDDNALQALKQFWSSVGARVLCMDAKDHDRIFAAVSHLPHMVAFALVNAIADMKVSGEDILQYSAGGFKDFTRIAASDPVMWRDIAIMNKESILSVLECFENSLSELKDAILKQDGSTLEQMFRRSRNKRRAI